ncbi:hypothetical protein [Maribacter luteus]|uniref:hypothetical protein n=1 Tax=Maribacter luteus TaxID=2594478 RepID=UPI002490B189|nr:hypothetical protein [Maribacter luteus]
MTKEKNNWLSPQIISLGYVILVCMGYFEKSFYYGKFDIDIEQYLGIEEYLLLFLPIGSSFIIFVVVFFGYFLLMISASSLLKVPFLPTSVPKRDINSVNEKTPFNWKDESRKSKIFYVFKSIFFAAIVFAPFFTIFNHVFHWNFSTRIIDNFWIIWSLVIMILGLLFANGKGVAKKESFILSIGGLLLLFVMFFRTTTEDKVNRILDGNPEMKVVLEFENKSIETDTNLVYIGQTKEFIFFRMLKEKGNQIIPKREISKINLIPKEE